MPVLNGYHNRIARVNLDEGYTEYEEIDEDYALEYIGGRGLGVRYVADNGAKIDPMSPENILCFMTGPLNGSRMPMSNRLCISGKSPLTGTIFDSHQGGWTGVRLKWAGLDGIVFEGVSEKPVYAYVEGGEVELRDASSLWGKTVGETSRLLKEKYGGKNVSVISIGPAGENLVKFACVISDNFRVAGRGGAGCISGYKKLKAIVIKSSGGNAPEPADKSAFNEVVRDVMKRIRESRITAPGKGSLSVYGTSANVSFINAIGAFPVKNAKKAQDENAERISGKVLKETILSDTSTCYGCPVSCKRVYRVTGKYSTEGESLEYETIWSIGANCGLFDLKPIARINTICNDYGMDTIELGNCMSVAMEASEKGLIRERIEWGDADVMIDLAIKTAMREDMGDVLAEGCARTAEIFGEPEIANQVKGMGMPAYDPRGMKGMGVAYATSNRGACHLRAWSGASELMGYPEKTDPLEEKGKGKLVAFLQDFYALIDSLDMCKMSSYAPLDLGMYLSAYNTMVGLDLDEKEFLRVGERIYNLERHYNNVAGFDGSSDILPERFLVEPAEGRTCDLRVMINEYYTVRGWQNGVVPPEKLRELDIEPLN